MTRSPRESGADDRYALSDPANLYLFQRRERALLELLHRQALLPLEAARIIDIGCGNGALVADLARYGARPALLHGVDLLPDRIASARVRCPSHAAFSLGNAEDLPYPAGAFDIALMFTVLSSILDSRTRERVATEAMRVLRPGGSLIIYDFTWNPGNRDVRGVRASDLQELFAGCLIDTRRVTLAPPILRRTARLSWTLTSALESLPFLRSHLLAAIRTPT
jgi:ubiquinone/menaquinone biosynthesis C-methylase UbiE